MNAPHTVYQSAEIPLSVNDFNFINHSNPARLFEGLKRPYRLITRKPDLVEYSNVIYTPSVIATNDKLKQNLGCLYDEELNLIENTLIRKRLTDESRSTDPPQFSGKASDLPVYEKPVLYLGFINPHFGHFILESIAKWWPLTEMPDDVDQFLFHVADPKVLERKFVKDCLSAMGMNSSNMLFSDQPMRFKKVFVPETSFQLNSHIYTKFKDTLNKLSISFGNEGIKPSDQPVFLSRSQETRGVRTYVGQEKVEEFLESRGVRIVHPSRLALEEQFKVVNEHKYIIGFQGSQLYNVIGALEPRITYTLTDRRILRSNLLIDKCFGHESTYAKVCKISLEEEFINSVNKVTGLFIKRKAFNRVPFNTRHIVDYDQAVDVLSKTGIL
jgi:hypothetical protein